LNNTIVGVVALAIMGIGMIIAGIKNTQEAAQQEKLPPKERKKKEPPKSQTQGWLSNFAFGGTSDMDLRRMGQTRINLGIFFLVIALIVAYVFIIR
jgi:putative Mn2+ efflux pump MntP